MAYAVRSSYSRPSTSTVSRPSTSTTASKPSTPTVSKPSTPAAVYTPSKPNTQSVSKTSTPAAVYTPSKPNTQSTSKTSTPAAVYTPSQPVSAKQVTYTAPKQDIPAVIYTPSNSSNAKQVTYSPPKPQTPYQQVAANNKEAAKTSPNALSEVKNLFSSIANGAKVAGDLIKKNGADFAAGAAVSADNNLFFGGAQVITGNKPQPDTMAFKVGKVVGDIGSMFAGGGTIAGGAAGEVGGVALDATGVGAIAGVPLNIASAGAIAYGGTVIVKSGGNLYNDFKDLVSFAKTNGAASSEGASNAGNVTKGAGEVKELKRPYIRKGIRQEVENRAEKAADGRFLDANEKTPIDGKYDLGHKPGNEHRVEVNKAQGEGLIQKEFNNRMNNPDLYQIENPSLNRSHKYEKK